ncbi:SDR family NAD(P)-dependent oxidoreductase [bacterium]|jgi:short-subunit dehydrogenase|nr:SDR family NAD(P)-dependent oxidoreductase [bacterium]
MVIIISGATSGIGLYLAERYAKEGHKVCGLGRNKQRCENLKRILSLYSDSFLVVSCDVRDKLSVESAVSECKSKLGLIDCIVANAGVSIASSGNNFNIRVFEKVFQTNVFGVLNLIHAVLPDMIDNRQGHVVGIGSLAAYRGLPGAGAYCSSKAAMFTFLESLRLDVSEFNIDVSVINPGYIKTPLTDKNRFKMPFLMSMETGGSIIYDAIKKRKAVYSFPFPLSFLVKLARVSPVFLYDLFVRRFKNDKDTSKDFKELNS